ncbi:MAG TPA: porin, partial [Alphaproteobacteria bacterium]|nr:porin [Alphaproteobacteria bacterium]
MKKILLGTTAIIGAALLAAPASAEVVNGNGLQLKITGYIEFLAGYISEDNDSAADRDYEIEDRSELNFLVNGKTDTGLTYGGKVG